MIILQSSELNHYRYGKKISSEEAEFAFKFKEFDPSLKTAAIFSYGRGKIAEYSNKISYDKAKSWYLPIFPEGVIKNEAYYKEIKQHEEFAKIIEGNCLECLKKLDVDYIIVNESFAKSSLEGLNPVFIYENFKVYRK